jgi:hypothetical protein
LMAKRTRPKEGRVMSKRIGPRFGRELFAAGLDQLVASWSVGGLDTDIQYMDGDALTPEQKAAIQRVIDAHDPDAPDMRTRAIADILESLTLAEVNTLNGLAAFRKNLWVLLARGDQSLDEDSAKVTALCQALGITPKSLFDR